MKNALEIIQFISYSSNTEVSKVSSWDTVKQESINGLNRAIRVLWNSKEWNFRRSIKKHQISTGQRSLIIDNYLIAQNGIRLNNKPLTYDKEIPFYDDEKGTPTKYYIDSDDKIVFYPIPDKLYKIAIERFSTYPVIDKNDDYKDDFTESTDRINISEQKEKLFIDCLSYFCNEILGGDPTDEEYQEATLRYSEVYKLLEKADIGTFDNEDSKGLLMPWQL